MARIAIIPARGGSKRIPKKNIRLFEGKPILAWSVEAALQSGLFDEVMVSTDDDDIAAIAIKFGARVPFRRSPKNSDDFASTEDVIEEVLHKYQTEQNRFFDVACCIYPTAPLITAETLRIAHDKFAKDNYDSLFPVLRFSYPIQRALKLKGNNIIMAWPENENKRSQDLLPHFHDAGQFYWIKVSEFLLHKKLYTDHSSFLELDEMDAQDIDNESDWKLAECKFRLRKRKRAEQRIVLLRADGNSNIGLGHIYRCLSIAQRLKEQFKFYCAVQNITSAVAAVLKPHATIINLPETDNYLMEAASLSSIVSDIAADIVVLDGYNFDTHYQHILKGGSAKIVSIDDFQPYYYVSDAVINHADGIHASDIAASPSTKIFTGTDFLLLRKEFIDLKKRARTITRLDNLLISFGGADPANLTRKALLAAIDADCFKQIHIVTGSSYTYADQLSSIIVNQPNVLWHQNIDAEQLITIMLNCDLAVAPASTISLEAQSAGMYLITGITDQNQQYIFKGLYGKENVTGVGDFYNIKQESLAQTFITLQSEFQGYTYDGSRASSDEKLLTIFNSVL